MNLFQFLAQDVRQVGAGAWGPRLSVNLGLAVRPHAGLDSLLRAHERNSKYTLFTAFVFAVLTYSLFLR